MDRLLLFSLVLKGCSGALMRAPLLYHCISTMYNTVNTLERFSRSQSPEVRDLEGSLLLHNLCVKSS